MIQFWIVFKVQESLSRVYTDCWLTPIVSFLVTLKLLVLAMFCECDASSNGRLGMTYTQLNM